MDRDRAFVSYSHRDRAWLDRLLEHMAALERWQLVETWSDQRIGLGADWEREITEALAAARIAVLLVSPGFLASKYIWQDGGEMDHIRRHEAEGMLVLPLIVRPCAWRLEEDLAGRQARPPAGRALSGLTESQVDAELAAFVYELAGMLGRLPMEAVVQVREGT
ncbi:MAG: toll/interleukin-1 receptor domain-containing protein [Actinoplanes sp.]